MGSLREDCVVRVDIYIWPAHPDALGWLPERGGHTLYIDMFRHRSQLSLIMNIIRRRSHYLSSGMYIRVAHGSRLLGSLGACGEHYLFLSLESVLEGQHYGLVLQAFEIFPATWWWYSLDHLQFLFNSNGDRVNPRQK